MQLKIDANEYRAANAGLSPAGRREWAFQFRQRGTLISTGGPDEVEAVLGDGLRPLRPRMEGEEGPAEEEAGPLELLTIFSTARPMRYIEAIQWARAMARELGADEIVVLP